MCLIQLEVCENKFVNFFSPSKFTDPRGSVDPRLRTAGVYLYSISMPPSAGYMDNFTLGFPLWVSLRQRSILIFMLILHLQGRAGGAWEPPCKLMFCRASESTGQKTAFTLFCLLDCWIKAFGMYCDHIFWQFCYYFNVVCPVHRTTISSVCTTNFTCTKCLFFKCEEWI